MTSIEGMLAALADGRTDLVFDIIGAGTPASSAGADGVRLIQWCAYYGDVSAIRFLLQRGEELEALGDNLDLNGAAFHGHWQLCQFLLANGAEADRPVPQTGESPLHAALCKAQRPASELVVEVLLAAGADPNRYALHDAETGQFMRDVRTRGETALHRAAAFGTERAIRLLLEAGAAREVRDRCGDSPLSWASWHLRPAHILQLLCFGEQRIHPEAVERSRGLPSLGLATAMETNLLGRPHELPPTTRGAGA